MIRIHMKMACILLLALSLSACQKSVSEKVEISLLYSNEITIADAFEISSMSVVREEYESPGGIWGQFYQEDARRNFPGITNFDRVGQSIVWFYDFRPRTAHREGSHLEVLGTKSNDGKLWYCCIPHKFCEGVRKLTVVSELPTD